MPARRAGPVFELASINPLLEHFEGAARAEATALESSSRGHLVGQGPIAKDIPKAGIAEAERETF
jgi:hypothetical protein